MINIGSDNGLVPSEQRVNITKTERNNVHISALVYVFGKW